MYGLAGGNPARLLVRRVSCCSFTFPATACIRNALGIGGEVGTLLRVGRYWMPVCATTICEAELCHAMMARHATELCLVGMH